MAVCCFKPGDLNAQSWSESLASKGAVSRNYPDKDENILKVLFCSLIMISKKEEKSSKRDIKAQVSRIRGV